MDTLDCTYHCNQTSPPMSQSNKRKAAPREVKKPLATVPPPAIYVLSKNSPHSLNIQVKLTSLTSLASISMSALLDSRATGMFINQCRWDKNSVSSPPLEPCFDIPNNHLNHLLNSLFLWLEKLTKKSSNQTTYLFSCQTSL